MVSSHGGYYGPKSYAAPPVKVFKPASAPIFRHEIPVVPVVRHVAPVVLPPPLPAPLPVVHALPPRPIVHALPAPLPIVHAAPVAVPSPIFSKFHSQDELGQASFGHVTADQSASNFRDAFGNQVGHYSYINPDGQEIVVQYTAGKDGFRVLSNFLPVAPTGPIVGPSHVPILLDTPEVHEATIAHFAAIAEAKAHQGLLPVHPIEAVLAGPAPVLDTPEVHEAKLAHFAAVAEAKARNAAVLNRKRRSPYGGSYSAPGKVVKHVVAPLPAPLPVVRHVVPAPLPIVRAPAVHALPPQPIVHALPAPLPIVHAAPVAVPSPIFSKFHSQDELGQASFGHVTADQSASNFRDAFGNQVGHYSYINPDGQEIVVQYTAGKDGFRVLSNFLPMAPGGPVVGPAGPVLVGPAPVLDTPEVHEAKLAHFAAVAEAKARLHH